MADTQTQLMNLLALGITTGIVFRVLHDIEHNGTAEKKIDEVVRL
jgi:hypothetical protein